MVITLGVRPGNCIVLVGSIRLLICVVQFIWLVAAILNSTLTITTEILDDGCLWAIYNCECLTTMLLSLSLSHVNVHVHVHVYGCGGRLEDVCVHLHVCVSVYHISSEARRGCGMLKL